MKTRLLVVVAMLVIALIYSLGATNAQGPNERARNFDGNLVATCDHPVDKEKVPVLFERGNGWGRNHSRIELVDTEVVLNTATCGTEDASTNSTLRTMAARSNTTWNCYGKMERNTLAGMNWRLQGWQRYTTNWYYRFVYWPPFTPIVDGDTRLGWSQDGPPRYTGPERELVINNHVYRGMTTFQARFVYRVSIFGISFEVDSASPAFTMYFQDGRCWGRVLR